MNKTTLAINEVLDAGICTALGDITQQLNSLGIPFFMIGAVARDIIAAAFGETATRKTTDLDLAIMVSSEEEFVRAKSSLVASTRYKTDAKQEQRLYFSGGIKIDLVPFGGIEDAEGKIHMPPSRAFVMNVRGFQEAFEASRESDLGNGLKVRIVTVEDLVLLKFIAWNDRPADRERDAEDIVFIFEHYLKFAPGSEDLLYEQHKDILEANSFDADLAAIQLLAYRIKLRAKPETLALLREITGNEPKQTSFVAAMLARKTSDSYRADKARMKLVAFRRGLD